MSSRLIVSAAAVVLFAFPRVGHADPEKEAEAYKTLGKAAFEAGNFAECAKQYKASNARVPDPMMIFNSGLCYEKAEMFAEALAAFSDYLAADPGGTGVGEANTRIELLQLKIKQNTPIRTEQPPPPEALPPVEEPGPTVVVEPVAEPPMPIYAEPARPAYDAALSPGLRAGASLGFVDDGLGTGLGVGIFAGYDLSLDAGPHPMGNQLGLRVDFATIDEADGDNTFLSIGAEYRVSWQISRAKVYMGFGVGFSSYTDGVQFEDDDVDNGLGLETMLGVDVMTIGTYAIGGFAQLHASNELFNLGVALTRY